MRNEATVGIRDRLPFRSSRPYGPSCLSTPSPHHQRLPFALATLATAACLAGPAHAFEYTPPSVQIGYGNDHKHSINKTEVAFQWDSGHAWGNPAGWQLAMGYELNVGYWNSTSQNNPRDPWEIGISPVFTLAWRRYHWVPFMEASIGVRLMSETRTSDDHEFSTAFQFGEFLGAGMAFGKDQRAAVGYRFQHISNAGIKAPNPGTTFHSVYVRYRF